MQVGAHPGTPTVPMKVHKEELHLVTSRCNSWGHGMKELASQKQLKKCKAMGRAMKANTMARTGKCRQVVKTMMVSMSMYCLVKT